MNFCYYRMSTSTFGRFFTFNVILANLILSDFHVLLFNEFYLSIKYKRSYKCRLDKIPLSVIITPSAGGYQL